MITATQIYANLISSLIFFLVLSNFVLLFDYIFCVPVVMVLTHTYNVRWAI